MHNIFLLIDFHSLYKMSYQSKGLQILLILVITLFLCINCYPQYYVSNDIKKYDVKEIDKETHDFIEALVNKWPDITIKGHHDDDNDNIYEKDDCLDVDIKFTRLKMCWYGKFPKMTGMSAKLTFFGKTIHDVNCKDLKNCVMDIEGPWGRSYLKSECVNNKAMVNLQYCVPGWRLWGGCVDKKHLNSDTPC